MKQTLKDRWTELKVEAVKLKAAAEVHGEEARRSIAKVIDKVESGAAAARTKAQDAADASAGDARESVEQLEAAFDSAASAVREAWRSLRR